MTQSQKSFIQGIGLIASFIERKREDILEDWAKSLDEEEEQVSNLILLSRNEFYNHIPDFLDLLSQRLRNEKKSPAKIARMHGAQRWDYGINLLETTKEWAILHQVLMVHINLLKNSLSLSFAVMEEAHKIVAELIHDGIINSIDEYHRLQNREAEAQMRDLETALQEERKEKLEYSQNLQRTSHDLKGVLFSLQTGLSLLREKKFENKTAEILNEMSIAAESLDKLLNDLLDLFRLEAGREKVKMSLFDAAKILNELCESLRPLADAKDLDLRCKGKERLSIQGDSNKVSRIAQNLLVNALKYTEEGYVEMSWEELSEEKWMLTVADTGPGLASTHAASLTTDSDEQDERDSSGEDSYGEGIGLLIVRQLCTLLDAVIEIDTEAGKGTTFRIVFPVEYTGSNSAES